MTYKASLPCTAAEARALAVDIGPFAALDLPPALVTSEAAGGGWRLDAYFERKPGRADLAALAALAPGSGEAPQVERLDDADWLTLSQAGLEPIRAGRFFVHTPMHRGAAPDGAVAFEIDAGRAFGTGQHETTTGCLIALDRLKMQGAVFGQIADIGTGTGLLAFAALSLWPSARAIASDIDPVAIAVAAENAGVNGIPTGRGPRQCELAVAAGLDHRRLIVRAPYDLIIANILAGPLIELARDIGVALAPGGRLILAGLLDRQARAVTRAYARQGLRPADRIDRGEWPTLVLRKPR
ncbi:MAG: 50S ribosomal protein L11 methyltransferase [Sphingomonas sp.]